MPAAFSALCIIASGFSFHRRRYWQLFYALLEPTLAANIDILHLFPKLTAIGQPGLQIYCDEWLRRPIAREYGIAQLVVDERLMLAINLDSERADFVDDKVFIPIDELLGYIVDAILWMQTRDAGCMPASERRDNAGKS